VTLTLTCEWPFVFKMWHIHLCPMMHHWCQFSANLSNTFHDIVSTCFRMHAQTYAVMHTQGRIQKIVLGGAPCTWVSRRRRGSVTPKGDTSQTGSLPPPHSPADWEVWRSIVSCHSGVAQARAPCAPRLDPPMCTHAWMNRIETLHLWLHSVGWRYKKESSSLHKETFLFTQLFYWIASVHK